MEKNPIIICGGKPIEHVPVLKARAALGAKLIRKDGSEQDMGVVSIHKVTTAFVALIIAALRSQSSVLHQFKYHQSGTGTTAEANTQIELMVGIGDFTQRAIGTQDSPGAGQYRSVATISYTASYAVTEHGLFNSFVAEGTMLDRSVFSAINVNNGDSIQFTYTLTINAES